MTQESARPTLLLKQMLHADGVCLWKAVAEGVAFPRSCEPPGLLGGAFAVPDLEPSRLEFQAGPRAARLLPLEVRAGLPAPPGTFAALHALGARSCGLFAFWTNQDRVPYNYHEIARLALHEAEHEVVREQAIEHLDRVSALLHGLVFALPQGLALVPRGNGSGLVNPVAAPWLGLSPGFVDAATVSEALERLLDRADSEPPWREEVQAVLRGEAPSARDCRLRLKDGGKVLRFSVAALDPGADLGWAWLLEEGTDLGP